MINTKHITDKLNELGFPVTGYQLGDFDAVGEFCAKKARNKSSELYKTTGCFFRPNYERGILIDAMIRRYRPKRLLEIGFGRGYWTICAARAMVQSGIEGEIITIDTSFDEKHIQQLGEIFPREWLSLIKMAQGKSTDLIPQIEGQFDMVYIDGDHTYSLVKSDWQLVKDRTNQFVIFDDYYMSQSITAQDVAVARVVDELEDTFERELIIMDRELFVDDRKNVKKDYGQVIVRQQGFIDPIDEYAHEW